MKVKFLKLLAVLVAAAFIAGYNFDAFAEEKKAKKTAPKTKKTDTKKSSAADKKTSAKKNETALKNAENAELKAIYDKKMIEAVKLFSKKKSELSKNTRAELEDILTISATQAREGNYEDAIYVIDEIETVLSGRKKQSKNIKVEDSLTGEVKNYQFDVNKNNKVVSTNESEDEGAAETSADEIEETSPATAPDGKFSIDRLSTEEQKLYKDLVEVLPIAEFEFNKRKDPDTARRLMRLRRVFYTLKKKGMGHAVDDQVIRELIAENGKAPKKSGK
jgi:hypothetical protein